MPIIFLSPSLQPFNEYVGGGNEQQYMNEVADAMEPMLRANAIRFTRSKIGDSLADVIRQSNSGNYDLHLALHSNAAGESMSGQLNGADMYYYTYSVWGKKAAKILAENYRKIAYDPNRVQARPTTKLVEVTKTNAPAVLVEVEYHDNEAGANWIRTHINEIAANLTEGLTIYFGLPYISDTMEPRSAIVCTKESPLNLRVRPNLHAPVVTQIPRGSTVTIYGVWKNWRVAGYQDYLGYADASYLREV